MYRIAISSLMTAERISACAVTSDCAGISTARRNFFPFERIPIGCWSRSLRSASWRCAAARDRPYAGLVGSRP